MFPTIYITESVDSKDFKGIRKQFKSRQWLHFFSKGRISEHFYKEEKAKVVWHENGLRKQDLSLETQALRYTVNSVNI